MGYLANDKNNGITISAKNDEANEYPNVPTCGQYGYRRHKARVLFASNQRAVAPYLQM